MKVIWLIVLMVVLMVVPTTARLIDLPFDNPDVPRVEVSRPSDAERSLRTWGNVSGNGMANYMCLWQDNETINASSVVYEVGDRIGINTTTPSTALEVNGKTYISPTGTTTDPTLAIGSLTSGISQATANTLSFILNGGHYYRFAQGFFRNEVTYSGTMDGTASSATNPTWAFTADEDTGVGRADADQLSLIAGGKEIARAVEATTGQFIISPDTQQNDATKPSLAFGDGNTGLYEPSDNTLAMTFSGTRKWTINGNTLYADTNYGGYIYGYARSATEPTFSWTADVDTGLCRAGADAVSLTAGGVNGLNVNETGGVARTGVNTTAPSCLLDVNGEICGYGGNLTGIGNLTGNGTTNRIPKWTGSEELGNSIMEQKGSNIINVDGSIRTDVGNGALTAIGPKGDNRSGIIFDTYFTWVLYAGSYIARFKNGGMEMSVSNFVDPAPYLRQSNTQTSPGYAFVADGNTGMYRPDIDNLGFTTNGTEKVRINVSGNVGINTTAPSCLLDVNGEICGYGGNLTGISTPSDLIWTNNSNEVLIKSTYPQNLNLSGEFTIGEPGMGYNVTFWGNESTWKLFWDAVNGSFSVGDNNSLNGVNVFTAGSNNIVTNAGSIALGAGSIAQGVAGSLSIGVLSESLGRSSASIGRNVRTIGDYTYGFGRNIKLIGQNSVGIGNGIEVGGTDGVGVGTDINITGDNSFGFNGAIEGGYQELIDDNTFGILSGHFFIGNTTDTMAYLNRTTGFLGIGTKTPTQKLDVYGGDVNITNGDDTYVHIGEGGYIYSYPEYFVMTNNDSFDIGYDLDGRDLNIWGDLIIFRKFGYPFTVGIGYIDTILEIFNISNMVTSKELKASDNITISNTFYADNIGNVNASGNITGNIHYANMYFHNGSATRVETIINTVHVFEVVNGFNQSDDSGQTMNGFTFITENGSLKCLNGGLYKVDYSISIGNGGVNDEYEVAVAIDNVIQNSTASHRKLAAAGDVGSQSGTGFLSLVEGNEVQLMISNLDGTTNVQSPYAAMNLIRIGHN